MSVIYCVQPETFKLIVDRKDGISHNGSFESTHFTRNKHAAKRGAIIAGEGGVVEFDWQTNEIIVRKHYETGEIRSKVETIAFHGGGDIKLINNFIGVMLGTEKSKTPLEQGLLSAYMCLKAKESAENHTFVTLDFDM